MLNKKSRLTQHLAGANPKTRICGVYSILHVPTSRYYVGQSKHIYKRWISHVYGGQGLIGQALREYPIDQFKFEVLSMVDPNELDRYEQGWIDLLDCMHPQGFNRSANLLGADDLTARKGYVTLTPDRAKALEGITPVFVVTGWKPRKGLSTVAPVKQGEPA